MFIMAKKLQTLRHQTILTTMQLSITPDDDNMLCHFNENGILNGFFFQCSSLIARKAGDINLFVPFSMEYGITKAFRIADNFET